MKRPTLRGFGIAATLAALTLATLTPASAAGRSDRTPFDFDTPRTVDAVERLERLGEFGILLTALDTAGLTETVRDGRLTLFAPTDAAFADLLDELEISAADLLGSPDLQNILLYHVLGQRRSAGQLLFAGSAETLADGLPVLVRFENGGVRINDSFVERANIRARSSIIHVIDSVLLPPSEPIALDDIVDVLEADGRFSVLLTALDSASLTAALEGDDRLTLFAPTDEAFANLLADLNLTSDQLLALPNLSDILLYHVVEGRKGAIRLLIRGDVETLQGDDVYVDFNAGRLEVNGNEIVNPNVPAPNGVIHVIDGVLLP